MSDNSKSKRINALVTLVGLLSNPAYTRAAMLEEVDSQPEPCADDARSEFLTIIFSNPDAVIAEALRESLLITLTIIGHKPSSLEKLGPIELCRCAWSSLEEHAVRLLKVSEASRQSNQQRGHKFTHREVLAVAKAVRELHSSGKKRVGRIAVSQHARQLLSLAGEPRSSYSKLTPARTERLMQEIRARAADEHNFWTIVEKMPLSPCVRKKSE